MAHLQNRFGLLPWHCDHPPLARKSI